MTQTPRDLDFERAQAAYEQNSITFRSLNQLMWQIPLIAMTLTGGLWFGVTKVEDSLIFKSALLLLAAVGNIGLIIILVRLRYLIEKYLNWIEIYNSDGFVSGRGNSIWNRQNTVKNVLQFVLISVAFISICLLGSVILSEQSVRGSIDRSHRSIAYYDKYARDLADNYEIFPFEEIHPELVISVQTFAGSRPKILDVGAGSGRDASWLDLHGAEVIAIDPSESMLTLAQARHSSDSIQWIVACLSA